MSVTNASFDRNETNGRWRWRPALIFLCVAGIVWGGWAWWMDHRFQSALEEVEAEILAGRFAIACRDLDRLLAWKADWNGEIAYMLGSCELARGRNQAAGEAWARVVPGCKFSERAIRGRVQILHESGLLADVERLIHTVAQDPRNDRTAVRELLVPMFVESGRIDEAERLIEDRWEHLDSLGKGTVDSAFKLVRQHIELTLKPPPVETVRAFLERAARLAPEDDRVWLGQANLAIRTGSYDEAKRWLDACQRRRPEDAPVWRARFNWGIATNRIDAVTEAVTHLPDSEWNPAQLHRRNAWLAGHRGDVATERRELDFLVAVDPADVTALGRLAALAEKENQSERAAEFLRMKADIDRLLARYLKLHDRNQPIRDAVELAHLAAQLGRRFEARVFLTIAISEDPAREDLRHDLTRLSAKRRG